MVIGVVFVLVAIRSNLGSSLSCESKYFSREEILEESTLLYLELKQSHGLSLIGRLSVSAKTNFLSISS